MPSGYIVLPIETQPELLQEESFDYLEGKVAGWSPSDFQLDTWLISALARQAAELRDVASDVPTSIFRYYGASLMGIPPQDSVAASVSVTINVKDTTGYTIPAGYTVGIRDANGVLHGFKTTQDVVIAAGTSATAAGAVNLTASEVGADSSGLGANLVNMELITSLDYVTSVVMAAATAGGVDAEDDDVYLDRLAVQLQLQAPRPILPNDFAAFSLRDLPNGSRALALDGYDAVALTYGNARTITVAIVDPSGNDFAGATKTVVLNDLQAQREVNFLVYVIGPTYTTVDVQFSAQVYPGYDTAAVNAAIVTAIQAFLNPATFGQPPGGENGPGWSLKSSISQGDLDAVVGSVQGVMKVNPTTFRTGAGAYGTADLALAGAAPLPRPGAVSGTVV